jgi:hypothetical protein
MNALDRKTITNAFHLLAADLHGQDTRADVFVVGGAALTMAFKERPATKDVDAVFTNPAVVRSAVERVGQRLSLPPDWLNDAVKAFVPPGRVDPDARTLVDEPGLRVMFASPRYILGMKVVAARAEDVDDIRMLADHLDLTSSDEVLAVVSDLYEGSGVPISVRSQLMVEEMFGPLQRLRSSKEIGREDTGRGL